MATVRSGGTELPRTMRADALRNRDAILAAARAAFEEGGVLTSLDGIADRAGVGNATLYRNFPTRNDLLAAVMEANLAAMLVVATELAGAKAARDALAEWLFMLTWELRIWHDLPSCVASAQGNTGSSMNATNAQLVAATDNLLESAKVKGTVVDTITAEELFQLVTALSWGVDRFGDDEPTARRRVAIAIAGIFHMSP